MLEIGCGDGRRSSLLANEVKRLTAIDPDQAMINQARKEINGWPMLESGPIYLI